MDVENAAVPWTKSATECAFAAATAGSWCATAAASTASLPCRPSKSACVDDALHVGRDLLARIHIVEWTALLGSGNRWRPFRNERPSRCHGCRHAMVGARRGIAKAKTGLRACGAKLLGTFDTRRHVDAVRNRGTTRLTPDSLRRARRDHALAGHAIRHGAPLLNCTWTSCNKREVHRTCRRAPVFPRHTRFCDLHALHLLVVEVTTNVARPTKAIVAVGIIHRSLITFQIAATTLPFGIDVSHRGSTECPWRRRLRHGGGLPHNACFGDRGEVDGDCDGSRIARYELAEWWWSAHGSGHQVRANTSETHAVRCDRKAPRPQREDCPRDKDAIHLPRV